MSVNPPAPTMPIRSMAPVPVEAGRPDDDVELTQPVGGLDPGLGDLDDGVARSETSSTFGLLYIS
jgi:hypothetical protein